MLIRTAPSLLRGALLLTILVPNLGCRSRTAGPKDVGAPKVTVAQPLIRPVTEFTELTGTLAAVKTADVRTRVSGYVQEVLFEEGAEVKAGQELIRLDPEPFEASLAQAKANLASAEAQRDVANTTEARQARIVASGAGSREELEQLQAQVRVTRASVQGAQAAVRQAELNLQYATVTAPFDGRIDRIFVNEGNVVTGGTGQGTVLTRIVTVEPIYAYFTVGEQTVLEYLRRALARDSGGSTSRRAHVPVEIRLRDEQGYPHKGTIDFASSELNPGTGTLQIRGTFTNPGPPRLLRPGLFVRGRIPVAAPAPAMLIPDEAIVTDQAQRVVYVVGPGNRVLSKPVTLGPQSQGLRVVEGLAATDQVIIRGLARIQPDMLVEPVAGEVKPTIENTAAGPGGWGPTGKATPPADSKDSPGAAAQPGAGGNAVPSSEARGRPANATNPPR